MPIGELIGYSEAILRVYNRYGRRDNKYKARIKILVHEMGAEKFIEEVEAEFTHLQGQNINAPRRRARTHQGLFRRPCV